MTRLFALLFLCLATLASPGAAQQATLLRPDGNGIPALQRPVSITLDAVPLRDAVRAVAERASLSVVYSGELPGLDRRVSLRAAGLPAAAALLSLVERSGLELRVFPSGQLVLVRQPLAVAGSSAASPDQTFVSGAAAFPAVKLAEVVITPGRFGVERDGVEAPMALSREDLETAPQLGEDVFRMMSRLPGVAAGEVSAKFAVRGGANEELLVLLDGLELVEPFHVKDFDGAISILDGEALGGVNLTTGGFTAEHGDRLTGVFEMHTSPPPPGGPHTEVGISFSNARFLSQGAFAGGKGQWLVSGRRGYLDVLLKLIHEDDDLTPRYGDALAKVQYQLGANHVVSIHGLYATDNLRYNDLDAEATARAGYHNAYAWANWRAQLGGGLSARTIASAGDLSWHRVGGRIGPNPDVWVSDTRGFAFGALEQQWSWEASSRFLARWGWRAKTLSGEYDYDNFHGQSTYIGGEVRFLTDTISVREEPQGRALGAYVSGRVRPWEALTVEAGLRFDEHSYAGDRVWSPRLNLAYALDGNTTLRAAWGIFHQSQGIHELQVQDGDSVFHPSERAEHRIVSLERRFGETSLRIEGYQRVLNPVRPRFDNLERFIEPFPEVEDDRALLRPERGEARGIELFAEGSRTRHLRWTASYALARIQDEFANGVTAPRELDQRHTFHAGFGYLPSPRWRFSAAWQYHTGWPTTARNFQVDTVAGGGTVITNSFGPVNGDRLPAYHRLDARVTRSWTTGRGRVSAFLDAYNVYNRSNPHGYDYSITLRSGKIIDVRRVPEALLPFLPSFGVSWEF